MLRASTAALPLGLLLGLIAHPARAQSSVEIFGGYSLARDPRDGVTLPAGWFVGAGIGLTPALSLIADASGQYKTVALFTGDARLDVHTLMAGLRASASVGPMTEFGQILAGVARTSGSAFGSSTIGHLLTVQPGIGIDYPLTRAWAARAQLDVRLMRSEPEATNGGYQYRFAAGLVYRRRQR